MFINTPGESLHKSITDTYGENDMSEKIKNTISQIVDSEHRPDIYTQENVGILKEIIRFVILYTRSYPDSIKKFRAYLILSYIACSNSIHPSVNTDRNVERCELIKEVLNYIENISTQIEMYPSEMFMVEAAKDIIPLPKFTFENIPNAPMKSMDNAPIYNETELHEIQFNMNEFEI